MGKGSIILFPVEEGDGKIPGMVSRIKENRPNDVVSIEQMGILYNGKEITQGEKVEAFAGALEEFTFIRKNGSTKVHVQMDTVPEWESFLINKKTTLCYKNLKRSAGFPLMTSKKREPFIEISWV